MTTTSLTPVHRTRHDARLGASLLVLGGVTYIVGGGLHPKGGASDETKLEQLRVMFLDDRWYTSHALLLLAMVSLTAGLLLVARAGGLPASVVRVLRPALAVALVATAAMVLHLLVATQEAGLRDGGTTFLVQVHTVAETVVVPLFGLAVVALAVVGGLTGALGNRLLLAMGVVGGTSYALAAATIAWTDRFDALFAVSALMGVWAIGTGVGLIRR